MPRLSTSKSRMIGRSGFICWPAMWITKGWLYPDAPEALVDALFGLPVFFMLASKAARESDGVFVSNEQLIRSGLMRIANIETVLALAAALPALLTFWAMNKPIPERRIVFEFLFGWCCACLVAAIVIDGKARPILDQVIASRPAPPED